MATSNHPFEDKKVEALFASYPQQIRSNLLHLRALIFETAAKSENIGELVETVKWGQPAYLPSRPRIGTTVRIGPLKRKPGCYAMFVHCQTNLVETYRQLYPETFEFEKNRALIFQSNEPLAMAPLQHCIAMALSYHVARAK